MSRVFRGWSVVAGMFAMLTVTAGLGFYGLPVYLRALTLEQGFSVSAVSGATAVFFLISGLTGLPVAAWMARHAPGRSSPREPSPAGWPCCCSVA